MAEELAGGMANAGAVVRRGDGVERPAPPTARALHARLRALRRHGFDGAPLPSGSPTTDASGRASSPARRRSRRTPPGP